jgi:uncharacterized glyoxalase superfamily protein PhnB
LIVMTTPPPGFRATDASGEPVAFGSFNAFEIYPMPVFVTIATADVAALASWYQRALGFGVMFETPGPDGTPMLVHLRRRKYQDVLLVPERGGAGPSMGTGLTISFQADEDVATMAARVRTVPAMGASEVTGPIDTPWNTTDLRITDPEGHRLVFTARREQANPEQAAKWAAIMDAARQKV